jgi:hypothetical protein
MSPATESSPARGRSIDWRHVGIVAWFAARFELRKGSGILFLFVASFIGLEIAGFTIQLAEMAIAGRDKSGHSLPDDSRPASARVSSEVVGGVVSWALGSERAQTDYLVVEQPALLSAIFLVLLFAFPFLVTVGAANQTAGDVGSRGLRYLLLRTERPNIFVGRLLATYAFMVVFATLLVGVVVLYVGLKLRIYPMGALLSWGGQGLLALCLLAMPYAALCAWVSGMTRSAVVSLMLCSLLVVGPLLVLLFLSALAPSGSLDVAWRCVPWGWKFDLLEHDLGRRVEAVAAMLGFTVLFGGLGLWTFRRRDL